MNPIVIDAQAVLRILGETIGLKDSGRRQRFEALTAEDNLLDSLGLDSLDLVDFHMRLEDTFGVEIPDEDQAQLNTITATVNFLNARMEPAR